MENIFKELPKIITSRTILRPIKMEDKEDIFAYCSDEEVPKYTTWYVHKSIDDSINYINFVLNKYESDQVAPWGIQDKNTGRLVGTCGFVSWNLNYARAELGYVISRECWGKGIMTEVVKEIISFGFENMDLIRIEARCHPDNIGSSRVMEKAGLEYEGVLRKHIFTKGKYEDVKMYSIIKE